jgi:hypothetical protein
MDRNVLSEPEIGFFYSSVVEISRLLSQLLVSVCGAIALTVAYSQVYDEIPKFHLPSQYSPESRRDFVSTHHFKHTLRAQRCRDCGRWTLPCHTVPISHGSTAFSEKKIPCISLDLYLYFPNIPHVLTEWDDCYEWLIGKAVVVLVCVWRKRKATKPLS